MFMAPYLLKTSKLMNSLPGFVRAIFLTAFLGILVFAVVSSSFSQRLPLDSLALELANQLSDHLQVGKSPPPRTLIVSLVDINQLHCTSKFGQAVPERLRVYLQHRGWNIVEALRGLTVKLQKGVGQFNLSDDIRDLASRVNCDVILTGTYMFHLGNILVNVRLISIPENKIISSAAVSIPADQSLSTLLKPVGVGCKAPKAFLKVVPWGEKPGAENPTDEDEDPTDFSMQEGG